MKKLFAVALVSVVVLAGCAARGVRVAEVKEEPGRYAAKSVSVNGVVTSSWGIPLVPFQLYNVDDGSDGRSPLSKCHDFPPKTLRVARIKSLAS